MSQVVSARIMMKRMITIIPCPTKPVLQQLLHLLISQLLNLCEEARGVCGQRGLEREETPLDISLATL